MVIYIEDNRTSFQVVGRPERADSELCWLPGAPQHPTCSWCFFMRMSSFLIPSTSCSRSVVMMVRSSKFFRRPSTSISKSFFKECSFSYLWLKGGEEHTGYCKAMAL